MRRLGFATGHKVIEVHSNTTHGSLECKFVNQNTSLLRTTISYPTPDGVEEQEYRKGFNHIFGNSELLPNEIYAFPWVETANNTPTLSQLYDIISSICILFR